MAERVTGGSDDVVVGAGVEGGAAHVADEAEIASATAFDLGDVDAALRIEAVERMGLGLHKLIEDRHNIAVGVLDDVVAHCAVARGDLCEIRGDKLAELSGAHEGVGVEAVVGA